MTGSRNFESRSRKRSAPRYAFKMTSTTLEQKIDRERANGELVMIVTIVYDELVIELRKYS